MRIDPMNLNIKNKLVSEYRTNGPIINRFDYQPFNPHTFKQRVADLKERVFERENLTTVLTQLNKGWGAPDETLHNIERLQNDDSVVVIGGQQAGLMTGPLYTIHKIISIINLAREQERQLGIPVIPVFWIAGEDHDFDEINHVMLKQAPRMKKFKIPQRVNVKQSISDLQIDKEVAEQWVNRIFETLEETEYTKTYYEKVKQSLEKAHTYVDFFAQLIFQFFNKEGLVLIDSGNPLVRELEAKHFVDYIQKQPKISEGVYEVLQDLRRDRYPISLDVEENDAHLFYHKNGERILLQKDGENRWVGKLNECVFSTDELIEIAENHPELLSNNVVTRPLMQELLFPSLAFLGGLAEVGYWSVLQPAFQTFGIKMPPVLPRLSFTLIDRNIEKKLKRLSIQAESAINNGVDEEKGNWLMSQNNPPIDYLTDQAKFAIERAHKPLKEVAKSIRADLGEIAEKNLIYLFQDIDFLEEKIGRALEDKYHLTLSKFDDIQLALRPEGGLQERCWNIFSFINQSGHQFIQDLIEEDFDYKQDHYIIYL